MTGGVRVKICGLNDPEAFDTAIAAGADWVGFNFFPPSPRYVTPSEAAALSARSPGGALRVGLFVDATPDAIAAVLDTVRLDALQVYGAMDLPALRDRFGLPLWRPVGIASAADVPTADEARVFSGRLRAWFLLAWITVGLLGAILLVAASKLVVRCDDTLREVPEPRGTMGIPSA